MESRHCCEWPQVLSVSFMLVFSGFHTVSGLVPSSPSSLVGLSIVYSVMAGLTSLSPALLYLLGPRYCASTGAAFYILYCAQESHTIYLSPERQEYF